MTAHLSPEEFRRQGHAVIDWLADYQHRVHTLPVRSAVAPGDIAAALPREPPPGGEGIEALLGDLDSVVLPGLTHWQHPSFFAYFPANSAGPAVLGDLLSSGLGVQGMVWATSPAATEVESRVMDWLVELLGLPDRFRTEGASASGGGVLHDTASTATLTALVAALHRVSGGRVRTDGIDRRYTVYCSQEAHSSVAKAVTVAGVGSRQQRLIRTETPGGAVDVAAMRAAVEQDIADGCIPTMIVSAVGTTGTGAIDDTAALAGVAADCGAWLHVDAAWAGVAAVAPELRPLLNAGLDAADSYVTNPHKWLLTTFDCSAFFVADRAALIGALAQNPEYLRTGLEGRVIDYRDWHLQLGRRFRSLKLWAVLRHYGAEGLAAHIRDGVELAGMFAAEIARVPGVRVTQRSLALVCFAVRSGGSAEDSAGDRAGDSADRSDGDSADDDGAARAVMAFVNDSGRAYLSHTEVGGRMVLRVAAGAPGTRPEHVRALVELIGEAVQAAGISAPG